MADQLRQAFDLLRSHYGPRRASALPQTWEMLVLSVLNAHDDASLAPEARRELRESVLGSPADTAAAGVEEIARAAKRIPRARQRAAALKELARWWTMRFGDVAEAAWGGGWESSREELARIRGLGIALVDRLLLFVGGNSVYPLERSSIRVACRHGWQGLEAEYEEWQSCFVPGLEREGIDLREFSLLMMQLGTDFCGSKPKCDECPLKPLLPEGGPYEE